MNTKNTIRRNYLIIRRIMRNDFPSAAILLQYLEQHDVVVTLRTLQRDMADIRNNFDVEVIYDSKKNGYYIDKDCTLGLDKLLYFLGLAESSDVILSSIKDRQKLLKYLSVSPNPHAKGVENIGLLLQAIQSKLMISFSHSNYQTGEQKLYTVEPYLLKEFEGMWYLFAYCRNIEAFRTFGLDRLQHIQVSDKQFNRDSILEGITAKFDDVYGLVYEPDNNPNAPIEEVRLRVSSFMIPYIQSLPIHASQIIHEDIVTLRLIVNPELENRIMSYGEYIEVLSPSSLRKKIKQRIADTLRQYDK